MNEYSAIVYVFSGPEELHGTASGQPWSLLKCRAVDARRRKTSSGEWEDTRESFWLDLIFSDSNKWLSQMAKNEIRPKMTVKVEGELRQKSYQDKQGVTRQSFSLSVQRYYLMPGSLVNLHGGPLPIPDLVLTEADVSDSFEAQLAAYGDLE